MRKTSSSEQRDRSGSSGFTMIEVAIGTVILAVSFLAIAGAMGSNMELIRSARSYDDAAIFLEETMVSLEAQSYDAVLATNGNRIFSNSSSNARFAVDLTMTPINAGMMAIRAGLVDRRLGRTIQTVLTYRSRR